MKKALIAMSGGVDSSVAALLMQQKGYECVGATMKLFENEQAGVKREKTCCSLDDVEDARSVAYRLHMPYYVFNFTANFEKEVMDRFVHAYENGWTPNPCIDCNRYLKFEKLYLRMQEMQMDTIVTGHYARVAYDETSGRYLLKKGLDGSKDQSYVLYNLTQEQLAHTQFPVGELSKHRCVRSPRNTAFSMRTSRTARTSALCRTGTMPDSLSGTREKSRRPATFSARRQADRHTPWRDPLHHRAAKGSGHLCAPSAVRL